jgi:GWxTD domain-containing protein
MNKSFLFVLASLSLILASSGTSYGTAMRGEGDFEFYVDLSPLPIQGDKTLELVQIAVPAKEILYKEQESGYEAALRISIRFIPEQGEALERAFEVYDVRAEAPRGRDLSEFVYVADSSLVDPGLYRLEVGVQDLNRKKKTLVGLLKGQYLSAKLKDIYVDVPVFDAAKFVLSEPVLIWKVDEKGGFVPNPMAIYGLRNDTLSFFVKGQIPEGVEADSVDVYVRIESRAGEMMKEQRARVPARGRETSFFAAFDLNSFPASSYRINVVAFCEGYRAVRGKDFTVSWELMNWQRPMRDLFVEARLLLPDKEFEQFQYWSIGEQESYLNSYWSKLDPTPHTSVNETYSEFMRRMYYADVNFKGFTRGALSDRGLIYIRFGQPDDIEQQPVPFNRGDVSEAMDQLEDKYKIITHSTSTDDMAAPVARIVMDGKSSPFVGDGFDTGGYELWIYNMKGEPLFDRDRLMTVHAGLRFLFVDREGVGEFKLVGTSEEYQDDRIEQ